MLLLLFFVISKAQNLIDWYDNTTNHIRNIEIINNISEWKDCPGWTTNSSSNTRISQKNIFGFLPDIQFLNIKQNSDVNVQCITIEVPLDWNHQTNEPQVINYLIARIFHSSNNIVGGYWILDGGPGGNGTSLYAEGLTILNVTNNIYDVYVPTHRGTSIYSSILQCPAFDNITDIESCVTYLNNTYGNYIYNYSTYSASLDLGYAIKLMENNFTKYVNNTIVYGVSYGTYYLNQFLTVFPNKIS